MAGLVQIGQNHKGQAKQGLQMASSMQTAREDAGDAIEVAEKGQRVSAIGTGAGIGMMVAGPAGAAMGAGIGLLASELF